MIALASGDDQLLGLVGKVIPSPNQWGVSYQVVRPIGIGGMAAAMLALREAGSGVVPVVLKILTPEFVLGAGAQAAISVQKEVVALHRLNERVPPTPFVVRLLEAGSLDAEVDNVPLALSWLALEYVHGGAEGTTLTERVEYSIRSTGSAFDPLRAADALRCVAAGLDAVHGMGVIHRDLKPNNVLCCGFGEREILKIADFGLARPGGMSATFQGSAVGTPGYSAPEQLYTTGEVLLPSSDVFGLAAVTYFLLTGEDLFSFRSLPDMVEVLQRPERPSIADSARLSPGLRRSEECCHAIDQAVLRATAFNPAIRQASAGEFASQVLEPLLSPKRLSRTTVTRLPKALDAEAPTDHSWTWLTRHRDWPDGVVRDAAFDGDGRCLAVTTRGAAFWDGATWRPALTGETLPFSSVLRTGPARWLMTSGSGLYSFSDVGLREVARHPEEGVRFDRLSGTISQMLMLVGQRPGHGPTLYRLTTRGWLEPIAIPAAVINGIARLSTTHWVLAGRGTDDKGYLALCSALEGTLEPIQVPDTRALVSVAADQERGVAVAVGTGGLTVRFDGHETVAERLPNEPALSVAGVDVSGGYWAGGTGCLWFRSAAAVGRWLPSWQDPDWKTPLASVYADSGVTMALSATGAVLEGLSAAARRASR